MKKLLLVAVLLLASCNDQQQIITTYRYMVVHPDESMYYCPVLKQLPSWQTLKDSEVARTVVTLYKNNITCRNSLDSIRKFLKEADVKTKKGSNRLP